MKPQTVLDFWFGAPDSAEYGQPRKCWFEKNPVFDEEIRTRFSDTLTAAAGGRLADWENAAGSLALIIVLDQFPRNLFRNDTRAFATDALALSHAQRVVEQGWDARLTPLQRVFAYLPYEHSEDLAMQDRAVNLFAVLTQAYASFDGYLDYAERHREVIRRFGRFPHRNASLGRASTAMESDYLSQPGAGF